MKIIIQLLVDIKIEGVFKLSTDKNIKECKDFLCGLGFEEL